MSQYVPFIVKGNCYSCPFYDKQRDWCSSSPLHLEIENNYLRRFYYQHKNDFTELEPYMDERIERRIYQPITPLWTTFETNEKNLKECPVYRQLLDEAEAERLRSAEETQADTTPAPETETTPPTPVPAPTAPEPEEDTAEKPGRSLWPFGKKS